MKQWWSMPLLVIFLLLSFCSLAQSPRHDLLKSLDKQRFTAQIQKDSLTLSRLLGNDLLYTHSSGIVETKQEFIHSLVTGRWIYQAIDTDNVTVRFYGPVAILTGRARVTLLINGQSTPPNKVAVVSFLLILTRWLNENNFS